MHPDLDTIVAADVAAWRDVEGTKQRLAGRETAERARLQAMRETAGAEARARLDADAGAIRSEGRAKAEARRAARSARRDSLRQRADGATASAVALYVRIVRGDNYGGSINNLVPTVRGGDIAPEGRDSNFGFRCSRAP